MILHFESLREDCPMAMQLIERATEYEYSAAYGTLIHKVTGDPVTHAILEGFFDTQGWFMSVYPTKYPGWNGILSDLTGQQLHNDPASFLTANSRNHAKSLISGITIKMFEETVKSMIKIPTDALVLERKDLIESAKKKELNEIQPSDLSFQANGLLGYSKFAMVKDEQQAFIMKNEKEFPFIGMVVTLPAA